MSAYVVRQLRADVDRLRRSLVDGDPVGVEFAHTVRTLHAALDYYEQDQGRDPYLRTLARPNLGPDEERHARTARR